MPLSAPADRKHVHTRSIEAKGFQREDGMWDVEANLRDVKTYEISNDWRGALKPGDPIHDMWVRLTVDNAFVVQVDILLRVNSRLKFYSENKIRKFQT